MVQPRRVAREPVGARAPDRGFAGDVGRADRRGAEARPRVAEESSPKRRNTREHAALARAIASDRTAALLQGRVAAAAEEGSHAAIALAREAADSVARALHPAFALRRGTCDRCLRLSLHWSLRCCRLALGQGSGLWQGRLARARRGLARSGGPAADPRPRILPALARGADRAAAKLDDRLRCIALGLGESILLALHLLDDVPCARV